MEKIRLHNKIPQHDGRELPAFIKYCDEIYVIAQIGPGLFAPIGLNTKNRMCCPKTPEELLEVLFVEKEEGNVEVLDGRFYLEYVPKGE